MLVAAKTRSALLSTSTCLYVLFAGPHGSISDFPSCSFSISTWVGKKTRSVLLFALENLCLLVIDPDLELQMCIGLAITDAGAGEH